MKSSPRAGYPPSGYQSKLAQAGDSKTVSPARAQSAAASTAACIDVDVDDGHHAGERLVDDRGRLAEGDDRLDPIVLGRHAGEVEALVAPAGQQHDVGEAADRRDGGVWRGCLRVVEPARSGELADRLDPVRRMLEHRQSLGHGSRARQARLDGDGGSSQRVADIVWQVARHRPIAR